MVGNMKMNGMIYFPVWMRVLIELNNNKIAYNIAFDNHICFSQVSNCIKELKKMGFINGDYKQGRSRYYTLTNEASKFAKELVLIKKKLKMRDGNSI